MTNEYGLKQRQVRYNCTIYCRDSDKSGGENEMRLHMECCTTNVYWCCGVGTLVRCVCSQCVCLFVFCVCFSVCMRV